MRIVIAAIAAFLLLGTASFAQAPPVTVVPQKQPGSYSAATVTGTASTIVAANAASAYLEITNTSASATVCLNLGATATISGTQCAAGEITLPPLWQKSWPQGGGTFVPTDAVSAISSAAGTQVTLSVR